MIKSRQVVCVALSLALAGAPLVGCSSNTTDDGGDTTTTAQMTVFDPSSFTTLDQVIGATSDDVLLSYGFDGTTFIAFLQNDDQVWRAVATLDAEESERVNNVDITQDDEHNTLLAEAAAGIPLTSIEDVSSETLDQATLDSYVGKTGQELVDAGFAFESYSFYGGEQTGANFAHSYFSYNFTFDTTVTEDQTEDEGAALMGATIVEVSDMSNLADSALDPANA